jgi:mono/diheme cytochrome c family protein
VLLLVWLWLVLTSILVSAVAQDERKTEPPPAQQQDAQHPGQVDFDRVCKVCHGPEARGDAGPRLVPFSREYEELLGIVREGTGQMPPISARELPDKGVAEIVAYLRSLSP